MKTFYVSLTSGQLIPYLPSVLDHWYIISPDPITNQLTGYFTYPSVADVGTFLALVVENAGTGDANGIYYYRDNHFFYQDTPNNGYSIQQIQGKTTWDLIDSNNEVAYYTNFSTPPGFYGLADTWYTSGGAVSAPTVTLTAINTTYNSIICGGYFFPWGYQVDDQTQDIQINGGVGLKGDTTIVFVPSGIDTTYHDVLKIIYDPGNGEDILTINRPILAQVQEFSFSNLLISNQFDSPIYKNVAFTYRASSYPVTYFPTVTALYGDLTRLFYNYSVTIYPNSIYDVDGVHLVGVNQIPNLSGAAVSLLAIESRDSIVGNITIPSK